MNHLMKTTRSCSLALALVSLLVLGAQPASARDEYRTIGASLRHATPSWSQTRKASGHPVGCGPTAWAIVFGYWKQHKGKTRLLEGVRMPHRQTRGDALLGRHMEEIARDTRTTYGSYRGSTYGRTLTHRMLDARSYVTRRGYRCTVDRVRGTEFDKFRRVKAWLDRDRPVIILINDPARAFSSLHYPVIERAELKQKRVLRRWRDRDVRYYVNFGNGTRRWIWVRQVGRNTHPHTGSFSMFLMDIQ